jgi:hypothetical protein
MEITEKVHPGRVPRGRGGHRCAGKLHNAPSRASDSGEGIRSLMYVLVLPFPRVRWIMTLLTLPQRRNVDDAGSNNKHKYDN